MEIKVRNVNQAFREMVLGMLRGLGGSEGHSAPAYPVRTETYSNPNGSGEVYRIAEPVTLTYARPEERVLFNAARDCNPFFHLYESLWMLAGRNDVAPLTYYSSKYKEKVSDDGFTQNGAYGYRWRHAEQWTVHEVLGSYEPERVDQLAVLIDHLKRKPESRRAVLVNWNVEDDLLKIDTSKDVCCNLCVTFELRENDCIKTIGGPFEIQAAVGNYSLDMTVFNRSNDLIWGMLGANAVHFSFLQEYVAAHLGVKVGLYHQISSNVHVYESNWKPDEWLSGGNNEGERHYRTFPLVRDPETFDEELPKVVDAFKGDVRGPSPEIDELTEPFFRHVAGPMLRAFELHKLYGETRQALRMCELIRADDWKVACLEWLKRRMK